MVLSDLRKEPLLTSTGCSYAAFQSSRLVLLSWFQCPLEAFNKCLFKQSLGSHISVVGSVVLPTSLATIAARLYGKQCWSGVWATTLVLTEIYQQLLDGLPWNVARTLAVPREWIRMTLRIPFFSSATIRSEYSLIQWNISTLRPGNTWFTMNCNDFAHPNVSSHATIWSKFVQNLSNTCKTNDIPVILSCTLF